MVKIKKFKFRFQFSDTATYVQVHLPLRGETADQSYRDFHTQWKSNLAVKWQSIRMWRHTKSRHELPKLCLSYLYKFSTINSKQTLDVGGANLRIRCICMRMQQNTHKKTEPDLEDIVISHVCSKTRQWLPSWAADADKQCVTSWLLDNAWYTWQVLYCKPTQTFRLHEVHINNTSQTRICTFDRVYFS